jgi:hypothetical protein
VQLYCDRGITWVFLACPLGIKGWMCGKPRIAFECTFHF